MRPVLILGLLCAGCAATPAPAPLPVLGPDTRMSDCALVPDDLFDPCMKQAFANIPVEPDRPRMAPPSPRPASHGRTRTRDTDEDVADAVIGAVDNAAFCAGTWASAWDAATCTSRLNRTIGRR